MENSLRLGLPFIQASQAQKHLPHNAAIQKLDQITHLSVISSDYSDPPSAPQEGEQYLVPPGNVDQWAGDSDQIAIYEGAGWLFVTPKAGWRVWDQGAEALKVFDGTSWQTISGGDIANYDFGQRDFYIQAADSLTTYYMSLAKSNVAQKLGFVLSSPDNTQAILELDDASNLRLVTRNKSGEYTDQLKIDIENGAMEFPSLPRVNVTCNYEESFAANAAKTLKLNQATFNPVDMHQASAGTISIKAQGTYHIGYSITLDIPANNAGTIEANAVKNGADKIASAMAVASINQEQKTQLVAQTIAELDQDSELGLTLLTDMAGVTIAGENVHMWVFKIA